MFWFRKRRLAGKKGRSRSRQSLSAESLEERHLLSASPTTITVAAIVPPPVWPAGSNLLDVAGTRVVTPQDAPAATGTTELNISLEAQDPATGAVLTQVSPGESFNLVAYEQDARTVPYGAFSVFTDVTFNSTLATISSAANITPGTYFPADTAGGNTATAGQIMNAGGVQATTSYPQDYDVSGQFQDPAGNLEVWSVPVTVPTTLSGTQLLTFTPGSANADGSFFETTLFNDQTEQFVPASSVNYIPAVLTVNGSQTTPTFTIAPAQVTNSTTTATSLAFTVTLSQAATTSVSVTAQTAIAGTGATFAVPGSDYTTTSQVLTFPVGTLTDTFTVPIAEAKQIQDNKTFLVNLSGASTGSAIGTADSSAVGTILNGDVPMMSVPTTINGIPNGAVTTHGTTDTGPLTFTVTLSAASTQPVTVDYAIQDGLGNHGAKAGSNYTYTEGTLTFPEGTTSEMITVPLVGETNVGTATSPGIQNLTLNLFSPVNANFATLATTSSTTGTITEYPTVVSTITVANQTQAAPPAGSGTMTFTVQLSPAKSTATTVDLTFGASGDTAVNGTDYVPSPANLSSVLIPANSTSATFGVTINLQTEYQSNKVFTVDLSLPTGTTGVTLASSTATGTITAGVVSTPTLNVTDNSGTYNAAAFAATETVAGVGSQSSASASLEGVTPTLTYYSGTSATGTTLSGAPTTVGTYTVLASFAGSTDYISGAASTTFTIGRAVPSVSVTDNDRTYNSEAFAAMETVAGVGSQSTASASLESVTPTLTYYSGTSATETTLSGAPTTVGTYTVLASFAGSTDYISGAASTTFTIGRAVPSVSVTDNGGTYNSEAFAATETVAGVGSQFTASASLEGVSPALTYYSGTSAAGTALSGWPTTVGSYTVLASFAGSTDYTTGTASITFTIGPATPTVSVTDDGGTYNGAAFAATDTASGVGSQSTPAASLEGVAPSLTYYSGTSATGAALGGAPSTAGTYMVLASFAGSADYTSGTASTTFMIATPPSSNVAALPLRTSLTTFPVSWSGTAGTGGPITSYNISVSIDDGPFNSWLTTSATSATYIENLPLGHTYGFISQAQDQAGNVEPAHTTADTTITTAQHPWQNPGNSMDVLGTGGTIVPDDALQVIDYLTNNGSGTVLSTTFPAGSLYYDVLGLGDVIPEDALNIIDFLTTVPTIPTTTTLTSTPATSQSGQSVTFTAKVVANELPTATPTGTVTFYDGSTSLGTGTLSSGVATFTTSTLTVGTHSIQAVYGGGASATVNFDGGNSNSLTQTVNAIAPTLVQPQVSGEFSLPLQAQSSSPVVSPAVVASGQASGPINNSSPSSSAASAPIAAASTSPALSSVKPLTVSASQVDSLLSNPLLNWLDE